MPPWETTALKVTAIPKGPIRSLPETRGRSVECVNLTYIGQPPRVAGRSSRRTAVPIGILAPGPGANNQTRLSL